MTSLLRLKVQRELGSTLRASHTPQTGSDESSQDASLFQVPPGLPAGGCKDVDAPSIHFCDLPFDGV